MGKYKHGHAEQGISCTYETWRCMKARCKRKTRNNWDYYGGRGISFCKRWEKFSNFLADMGERPIGMFLDRIDNNKGYCKENCRWASANEQSNNRSNNLLVEFENKVLSLGQWAALKKINYFTLYKRYKLKWPAYRMFLEPKSRKEKPLPFGPESQE
jgi:hypothetical protein